MARGHHCRSDFAPPDVQSVYPPDLELEPIELEIALRLDIPAHSAQGSAVHSVRARRAGPQRLLLHAVDFEAVRASDPDGGELSVHYDGRELALHWAKPFAEGELRRVRIEYSLVRPSTGLYFSAPDAEHPDRPLYAATDNEAERARHWLPCIDLPSARPRLRFALTAPDGLTFLANGRREREQQNGDGTRTSHWALDYPCPSYLTCFAVGELVQADDGECEGMPVAYFTTREFSAEQLLLSFGRTKAMLSWMRAKLDHPFPWPKYYQFALPQFGGAMENSSLVSWDDAFVVDETLAKEWGRTVDQVNVHEMAHSYFGDMLVVRDFAHAWLKESWATYMETCWLEDSLGTDERDYNFYAHCQRYFSEADTLYKRPVVTRQFSSSWSMYDAHLYPGGAARLHMLRCELGDASFWAAVRDYVKRYREQLVETDDFRRVLEQHSGRSLGKFFDQWLHGKGYPALKVGFSYDPARREGSFSIEQTQEDAAQGIGLFEFPLEVGWVIGGELHTRRLQVRERKHTLVAAMESDPEQVRIDPRAQLLAKLEFNPGDSKLRLQLRSAPDVVGRIRAGAELAKTGKRANVAALLEAWPEEPFWGVRTEWARALAASQSEPALEALAELVGREQDPLVLEHLLRAAGAYRDPRIRSALRARLERGIPLYRAQAAAYEALGAQRDDAPLDLLGEASRRPGYGGLAQAGAFRALAASRSEGAIEPLLRAARAGGAPLRARPHAIAALGQLGRSFERRARERVVEALCDLLRDPSEAVRLATARALGALGDAAALPALEAAAAASPAQHRVTLQRLAKRIRDEQTPRAPALEKDLEQLREKLRKLEDRLGQLEAERAAARD